MSVPTDPRPHREDRGWRALLAISAGVPIIIALMLFAFLAPTLNSGPEDLPIAVTGPDAALTQLDDSIEEQYAGAVEFDRLDDAAAVESAIGSREAVGGIVVEPADGSITIYTAKGNGAPYADLLHAVAAGLQGAGQRVETVELAPVTAEDPHGAALAALGLPLAFGGMASAAILILLLKRRPWHILAGSLAISLLSGFVVAAILQYGYDVIDGSYVMAGVAISAGVAATSLFVTGLGSLIGPPAVGIGAILTIFVSNPLSGLATGWWWLPRPWGAIGQYLPIGADGHILRSVAFFDGRGAGGAWAVLIVWITIGITLNLWGGVRLERRTAVAARGQVCSRAEHAPRVEAAR
ncbi:ABC transporter permease [Brachybacterium sp. AOP43-C2-M15]|uniref:ABC transporter permease n=1 Tax=Brachybacterium sp. AOP43-C2-M15 TaxID=3457661 RepID=UPI004034AC17